MACNRPQPYSEDVLNGKSDKGSKNRGKEEIVKSDASAKSLPNRVFVVQFRDRTEPRSARFAGRAEHVMSGETTNFETPEELVNFFERVMNQLKPRSQKAMRQ
jgi:hypothetical protein